MRKVSGRAEARASTRHTLSYQLQEIIDSRGLSSYAVAKLAGVDPGVVSRWMNGVRGITFDTADRLAEALGVRLVETSAGRSRARPSRPARPASSSSRRGTAGAAEILEISGDAAEPLPASEIEWDDDAEGNPCPGTGNRA